jgi:thiamine-phosphate pyrophosphorylase
VIDRARVHGLYAIADTAVVGPADLTEAVAAAIDGGAAVIQYRDKGGAPALRLQQAQALASLCRERNAVFVVNDDPALAQAVEADGVHVGREDPGLAAIRARVGARMLIGVSCYNELGRAVTAQNDGADYVAFGSFYPSPTKPAAVRADPELLRRARARLDVPIVAIGGITPANGAALVEAGADALAVITGVFAADDIRAAARRYAALFTGSG